jgi:hypothetical protein
MFILQLANDLVHKWYKEGITGNPVIPFNERLKSIDEIMANLEAVSVTFFL